jgi:hypothetical protein
MNKQDLITLFSCCNQNSVLFAIAQEAAKRLKASSTVRIIVGEAQPSIALLHIYASRLERKNKRSQIATGLKETVETFGMCGGQLQGSYVEIDNGMIYFWKDEQGNLAGCVF